MRLEYGPLLILGISYNLGTESEFKIWTKTQQHYEEQPRNANFTKTIKELCIKELNEIVKVRSHIKMQLKSLFS